MSDHVGRGHTIRHVDDYVVTPGIFRWNVSDLKAWNAGIYVVVTELSQLPDVCISIVLHRMEFCCDALLLFNTIDDDPSLTVCEGNDILQEVQPQRGLKGKSALEVNPVILGNLDIYQVLNVSVLDEVDVGRSERKTSEPTSAKAPNSVTATVLAMPAE